MVDGAANASHVDHAHTGQRKNADRQNAWNAPAPAQDDEPERNGQQDYNDSIERLFGVAEPHTCDVFQVGGQRAEMLAEAHIVYDGDAAQHPEYPLKHYFAFGAGQTVEDARPDHEQAEGKTAGADQVPAGMIEQVQIHKFLRRCFDDRRGDEQTGQQGQKDTGAEKQLFVGSGLLGLGRVTNEPGKHQYPQGRDLEQNAQRDKIVPSRGGIEAEAAHCECDARKAGEYTEDLLGVLQLVEDGFNQRKQVVQRPVKHQSGRRSVEEEQKEDRHGVELDLRFQQTSLGENDAGDQVDTGHDEGQYIDRQPCDDQQSIRPTQIGDRAKGDAVKQFQPGEETVSRNKEWDLKKKRGGPL